MSDVPVARASVGKRLLRLAAIVLAFVAIGPAIGGCSLIVMIAAVKMGVSWDLTTVALFGLIYGVVFAYLAGLVPAALVGLIVGVWQVFFGRVNWLMALGFGLVAGIAFMYFIMHGRPSETDGGFPQLPVILILTCVLPTMICWLIVRAWDLDAPPATGTRA